MLIEETQGGLLITPETDPEKQLMLLLTVLLQTGNLTFEPYSTNRTGSITYPSDE